MPLYEYECDANGHRFEQIQKYSDPPVERCPVCGSPVHKLLSSPAIQFKGTGWYITDYARKDSSGAKSEGGEKTGDKTGDKAGEAKDAKADKSGETKSASKTDAKSETKTETKT